MAETIKIRNVPDDVKEYFEDYKQEHRLTWAGVLKRIKDEREGVINCERQGDRGGE